MTTLKNLPFAFSQAVKEIQNLKPINPVEGVLYQYYADDRKDSILCGTLSCINTQGGDYNFVRIEGYQPPSSDPNAVKIYDFWSESFKDNYATTNATTPSGYVNAVFTNGYALNIQKPGAAQLKLYWSSDRKDMMTVATQEGIDYANKNKYELVNGNLGYVYTKPQTLNAIKFTRWAYSMELLLNALN